MTFKQGQVSEEHLLKRQWKRKENNHAPCVKIITDL